MKIDHLAIWVGELDKMRDFYAEYFSMTYGEKYTNPVKGFSSYFLRFPESETRIELMSKNGILPNESRRGQTMGLAHFSISVGSKKRVDELKERFRADGYVIEGEPRTTGDGYYESVILDPEGNVVEVTE